MKKTYWIFGGQLEILEDETATDSRYDLIIGTFTPGTEVPLHQHHKYSESILVTEGELTVFMKNKTVVLQVGDHVFIPKSTPHAIVNSGNSMAKAVTVASPSGFAHLIREIGLPGKADGTAPDKPNDMALFMKIASEIGDELIGPPGSRP